jgi:hypothetical protein
LNVPPGTTIDAQQSALPLEPQVFDRPVQEPQAVPAQGAHVLVVVLQLPDAQSALFVHSTHCDVVPRSLHRGVDPEHGPHAAPQLASVLQTAHVPPPHCWLLPHGVSVGA